jgi:hypothetical protein
MRGLWGLGIRRAGLGRKRNNSFGACNGGKQTYICGDFFLDSARIDIFVADAKTDAALSLFRPTADIAKLCE